MKRRLLVGMVALLMLLTFGLSAAAEVTTITFMGW
ncbi:hypothetical protein SDC9_209300 [bioreactor metagenome]|uniref:Uncharacterized protein n=1 Tax=bioreactor metagenome TaxID=1076179 RepID=A0A645JEF5_9ZZZZ